MAAMENEPRDERQVQAAVEVRTPPWLPGVTASLSYKRIYEKRGVKFIQSVADLTNESPEEIGERIAVGDSFADLVNAALSRAVQRGDKLYVDVLTSLVAAALVDDAKIDESAYLVDRIIRLEPIHIRVLMAFHEEGSGGPVDTAERARQISVSIGIFENCLVELAEVGFVERDDPIQFLLTDLGNEAVEEIIKSRDGLRVE